LPGIDDGAPTAADGVAMLEGLKSLGFTHVVATPHMRPGMFDNEKQGLTAAFDGFLPSLAGRDVPQLSLSSEHYFDERVYTRLLNGEALPYPSGRAAVLQFYEIDFPPVIEERLFDQRIVMIRGPLTNETASSLAAALLTLDAAGPTPVQLHVASDAGELTAALAVIDVIDAMAAPVHVLVTSMAGGAVVAVLAAAAKRSAYRHARFILTEPRATGVTGTADEVTRAAGQHLRELEEVVLRLAAATGQVRSRIEDDLAAGRRLNADEAVEYGLIDAIVGKE
jgi:ATP-dependent Clp protease protease subunit